jgi:hypothetical protein
MQTKLINGEKNQYEITTPKKRIYKCYSTIIVKQENGITYLDVNNWNLHRTISKFRAIFLGERTRDTEKKINEGIYQLKNLNR